MFSGKRKGFSVFTPLVGTLVILITFLIVAWMLESEKWNFNGLAETYQTIQMTGINQEAQDRFIATIRDTFLGRLEKNVYIEVDQCRNDTIAKRFGQGRNSRWQPCEAKAWNETLNQARVKVVGLGLSSDYLTAMIENILDKYSLIRINTNLCSGCEVSNDGNEKTCTVWKTDPDGNVFSITERFERRGNGWEFNGCENNEENCPAVGCIDPTDAVKDVEMKDCGEPHSCKNLNCLTNCDGRINIISDFTNVSNSPAAKIRANTTTYSELDVYLPNETRTFTSNDPLGYYALVTSWLFQRFTILDKTWHYVGDTNHHTFQGSPYGDGLHWYHYKYAVQARIPGFPVETLKIQNPPNWHLFGNVSQTLLARIGSGNQMKPVDLMNTSQDNPFLGLIDSHHYSGFDSLRLDNLNSYSCQSSWSWNCFKDFDIGIANFSEDAAMPYDNVWSSHITAKNINHESVFPGGNLTGGGSGHDNVFSGSYDPQNYLTQLDKNHFLAANSTGDYDKKFFRDPENLINSQTSLRPNPNNPLAYATQKIINHLKEPTLKVSAGYSQDDIVKVNLTVNSTQYYLCWNSTGGNNWDCGQYMLEYIIPVIGTTTETCGSHGETCINQDALSEESNWFLSLPLNFSCYTCVMYKVDEDYNIWRNTHEDQKNTSLNVITFSYTRHKEIYKNPNSENNLHLPVPGVNSTDVLFGNQKLDIGQCNDSMVCISKRIARYWCTGEAGSNGGPKITCGERLILDQPDNYISAFPSWIS